MVVNYLLGGWATCPSEKWWSEFVSWDDFPFPTEWKVIKFHASKHFQTTNQIWSLMSFIRSPRLRTNRWDPRRMTSESFSIWASKLDGTAAVISVRNVVPVGWERVTKNGLSEDVGERTTLATQSVRNALVWHQMHGLICKADFDTCKEMSAPRRLLVGSRSIINFPTLQS